MEFFGRPRLLAGLFAWLTFRTGFKQMKRAFEPENRKAAARRVLFFFSKTGLALACVFVGCLEWSRSESSVLLASRDPGSGPFLLWLYVLGTMGVVFWSVADQRARCRVCLRLMAFPGTYRLPWLFAARLVRNRTFLQRRPRLAPCSADGAQLGRRCRPLGLA